MAFRLYRSNRAERLADKLGEIVQQPLAHVFARECIVVQGPGMERWLSARLSQRLGVWANPWFPFPRTAVELVLDAALGPAPEASAAFAPDALVFRIAQALPAQLDQAAFADVARYLAGDLHSERLLTLSARLARTFDRYLVYRPELLLAWEAGEEQHFQAALWRSLTREMEAPGHLARRARRVIQDPGFLNSAQLPERISLFGISTLPPMFLEVLRAAARHIDVSLLVLSPAREYFGDLDRSQRHLTDIHGLLANLGRSSRELTELAIGIEELEEPPEDLFVTPGRTTLLTGLQSDLVELTERGKGSSAQPLPVLPSDDSLRVHSCHSRARELEVLRDELRARLERDPSLSPGDIIVFAPDIELYAPAIEAVFGASAGDDATHIPFHIADRKSQRASELCATFFAMLDLCGSRMALSDVLDLLHRPLVQKRFAIDETELDDVQDWLAEAGARWAIDAQHRERFGLPNFAENSLQFALDRLMLGYASAEGAQHSPFGVLPHHAVEGLASDLLGRVARYLERVMELARDVVQPRSVNAWSERLSAALDELIADDRDENLVRHELRSLLADLAQRATAAHFEERISLRAVRALLEERLLSKRASHGFLAGGITFCEHVPMRAIPFRVVCLLAMDDESFPRSEVRASFDRMATRRLGDRDARDDDRQLFLEALLSARDALIVTYQGRSAQDDGLRPKSALLDHLLRVVDRHFVQTAGDATLNLGLEGEVSEWVTREHALHRFDARYFRASAQDRFFSYDERALLAARAKQAHKSEPSRFVARPLAAEAQAELSLQGLERFFRHPQRLFLRERLSVALPRDVHPPNDREPTLLNALERYRIGDDLLRTLSALSEPERARVLRLSGALAPGAAGLAQLAGIEQLVQAVKSAGDLGEPLADREIELSIGDVRLTGRLTDLHSEARVERLVSTLTTKHKLSAWIRHLALCASGPKPQRTLLVGRKGDAAEIVEFSYVENAAAELAQLIDLYRLGMHMPLPYLHAPAQTFIDKLRKDESLSEALKAASNVASSARPLSSSDADDPYVRQVFSIRDLEQLAELSAGDGQRELSFAEVAQRVLGAMTQHMRARKAS